MANHQPLATNKRLIEDDGELSLGGLFDDWEIVGNKMADKNGGDMMV